jgi:hypothetical protein
LLLAARELMRVHGENPRLGTQADLGQQLLHPRIGLRVRSAVRGEDLLEHAADAQGRVERR